MIEQKKLRLDELSVNSFITSTQQNYDTVKGGTTDQCTDQSCSDPICCPTFMAHNTCNTCLPESNAYCITAAGTTCPPQVPTMAQTPIPCWE